MEPGAGSLGTNGQFTLSAIIGNNEPGGVAVDSKGRIYALNGNKSISVYAPGADGEAMPLAQIAGNKTGLFGELGIAVDGVGGIL